MANTYAQAEWAREKQITARFALSHMILFNLRKAGKIRSVSLRAEGKTQGARLYSVPSIEAFLARQEALESHTEAIAGGAK